MSYTTCLGSPAQTQPGSQRLRNLLYVLVVLITQGLDKVLVCYMTMVKHGGRTKLLNIIAFLAEPKLQKEMPSSTMLYLHSFFWREQEGLTPLLDFY
jgi:hypothetical protein